jgi:hypothetical protein
MPNSGIKQTLVGLAAGSNYVLRCLAYSEDGIGQPRVVVYDETNAAVITALSGTITSTEWTPDVLLFSFELPTNARGAAADCTSISIKLISTTAGSVGWHQCEVYANLLDNPSLDTGAVADPWIPDGWTNSGLDAGDSEIETVIRHSEGACIQNNAGFVDGETIRTNQFGVVNKYYCLGYSSFWTSDPAVQFGAITGGQFAYHSTLSTSALPVGASSAAWLHKSCVARNGQANVELRIRNQGGVSYVDDTYAVALDDVTLTVTPASQANSLEGTGIRVDGKDRLTQPITDIKLGKGKISFPYTPRHAAATAALFGNATPRVATFYGDANNYIYVDWAAANTLRLTFNAAGGGNQTANWDATGAIAAGTQYTIGVEYTGSSMVLKVNSTVRITITAACIFTTIPATAYWGSDNSYAQQNDAVFG